MRRILDELRFISLARCAVSGAMAEVKAAAEEAYADY